tara:strand:- start:938 stop:1945 length:1008 start_codon:yes stop_codon:yes gene_type:complete
MSFSKSYLSTKLDVVGIGNAIVDILIQVDDSFLKENNLKKGSMALLDEQKAKDLYYKFSAGLKTSGGSAANTLTGIAQLGGKSGFIGRVRNDELGKTFSKDIYNSGTIFNTPASEEGPSTARCMIFITPDAQRTMCTYLGASVLIEPEDLDFSLVENSKVVYLEGYLWDNSAAKRAFIKAAEVAKASGGEVALSLSDPFCVDRHRESFTELVTEYIDILFANESEIISLYQSHTFENALNELKNKCKISAITRGDKGSVILSKEDIININPYSFGKAIDTTGAGDIYAGGFLYGYTSGKDLKQCGKIGSICAGQIVTQLGPRSNTNLLELITNNL